MTEHSGELSGQYMKTQSQSPNLNISYIDKLLERASSLKRKNPSQSLEFSTKAFIHSKDTDYSKGIGLAYLYSGIAKCNLQDFENSLMDLFNALDVFENISDTPNNIATLNAIGMTYNASGQYKNAIDFYTQSVSEAKKADQKNETYAAILNNLGIAYQNIKEYSKALDNYVLSLKAYSNINDEQGEAIALSNIGIIHSLQNNNLNAVSYFESALEKKLKTGADSQSLLNTYLNIANAAIKNNDAEKAKVNFKKALEFESEIEDSQKKYSIYDSLGKLEALAENYDGALNYYKKALELIKESDNPEEFINTKQNLSVSYELKGDYKNALKNWVQYQEAWKKFITQKYSNEIKDLRENMNVHKEDVKSALENQFAERISKLNDNIKSLESKNESLQTEIQGLIGILEKKVKKPLIDILGFSQILRSEESQFTKPEIKNLFSETEQQAKQTSEYVSNIIDYKQIETGKKKAQIGPVNISLLISSVINSHKSTANEKNIVILLKSDPETIFINSDRAILLQVFDNLISNSLNNSPPNKEIFIKLLDKGESVRCEIKDNGSGYTKSEINSILNKNVISETTSINELNLVMVNKLSKLLNYEFWCDSDPGSGTSFVLEFNNNIS